MDSVFLNNILIQILRFAYFPVTNSKGKNSFHRHFNAKRNYFYDRKLLNILLYVRQNYCILIGREKCN